jgi:formylglycine-generating enzyme required for sulfatase activity
LDAFSFIMIFPQNLVIRALMGMVHSLMPNWNFIIGNDLDTDMTNQDTKGEKIRGLPIVYRVFLASPGDVRDERELARSVIEQVRAERAFRDRINLECIAWDQPGAEVAMEAGLTPQEAIKRGLPKPSECDLAVVILWSRMGTPLPAEYAKPDGTAYLSGTEWEYQDATTAAKRFGRPAVWVYRRVQVPQVAFNDPESEEKRHQWEKVDAFFQGLIGENGSLTGGVNAYQTPDKFRRQFEQHLRDRLTALLEELPLVEQKESLPQETETKETVLWTGAPYLGLEAFKPEQAPIFFGRGPEVDQLLEVLRDPAIRFVAVVGASGSGKSSLVAAGLIPRLRTGALPGSSRWVDITFKPGERGGDPFLALAYALKAMLGTTGRREVDLAEELRVKPDSLGTFVNQLLNDGPQAAEVLLVVDQFEEIFTLVDDNAAAGFIEFIEKAVGLPRVRVLATIRADFTANVAEEPALAQLFQGQGIFLLYAPSVLALTDMIRRPAQVAGYEIRDDLCDRILQDTGTGAGAMALMAFALHEVYERGKASGQFTLQDYEALNGVSGAIQFQAEKALQRVGQPDELALHGLFADLMEVNDQGVATRRRASLDEIRKDATKARLADALVDARILITDQEQAENPTIEVAHEAVFTGWRRLSRWIESNAGKLRVCRSLALAARDWQQAGAPPLKHLPDRATLKQYRGVRPECSFGEDAEVVQSFLGAARRRQRLWGGFLALVVLGFGILGIDAWLRDREMNWTVLRIWALAQVGLYDGPVMAPIPGTTTPFQMGSSDCERNSDSNECPQHPVTIQPFLMGKYEVTFNEYLAFVLDTDEVRVPPHEDWGREARPVIHVDWNEVKKYVEWLNKKVTSNKTFRLPTEAEWEYAARAGSKTQYWWGDEIQQDGKVWANCFDCGSEWAGKRTMPVGSFPANSFGLHDMHGNVWEWVEDDWHDKYDGAPDDGRPWFDDPRGADRVMRGGSWRVGARGCRSANRSSLWPDGRGSSVGFRLSRSVALGP